MITEIKNTNLIAVEAMNEDQASEKWARDNAKFVPNDQSEGMLYKSFLAGIEWKKNRIMPNTTEQPNNIGNESISEEEAIKQAAYENCKLHYIMAYSNELLIESTTDFEAGVEWQKNRELPNTTEQPNNIINESWESIFKRYSDSHSLDLEQVRYWFIPLIEWMNKNYPRNPFADKELRKEIEEANFTEEDFKEVSESFEEDDIYDAVRRHRESHPEPPETIDEDELVEKYAQLENWIDFNYINLEDNEGRGYTVIEIAGLKSKILSLKQRK